MLTKERNYLIWLSFRSSPEFNGFFYGVTLPTSFMEILADRQTNSTENIISLTEIVNITQKCFIVTTDLVKYYCTCCTPSTNWPLNSTDIIQVNLLAKSRAVNTVSVFSCISDYITCYLWSDILSRCFSQKNKYITGKNSQLMLLSECA